MLFPAEKTESQYFFQSTFNDHRKKKIQFSLEKGSDPIEM
jgi:hypothetical protein